MKIVSIGEWQNQMKRAKEATQMLYRKQVAQVKSTIGIGISIVWLGFCSSLVVYMCVRAFMLAIK